MFFKQDASLQEVIDWVSSQLSAVHSVAKNGIDVEIKPHRHPRTVEQNRFLMAILVTQVRFYNETGFMPEGCKRWMMQPLILKEYWKARYGIERTSKLSTKGMTEFIDFIQRELVEETQGEWQILTTDSVYLKSLLEWGQ